VISLQKQLRHAFLAFSISAVIVGVEKSSKTRVIFALKNLQEFHLRNVASMWQLLGGGERAAMAVRWRQTVLGTLAMYTKRCG
jgi:hypothetical protein